MYKSRKKKENARAVIRECIERRAVKCIHFIDDDYLYWIARYAWQAIHNGKNYEDYFKSTFKRLQPYSKGCKLNNKGCKFKVKKIKRANKTHINAI